MTAEQLKTDTRGCHRGRPERRYHIHSAQEEAHMRIDSLSKLLAVVGWASVFTESWLILLGRIEPNITTTTFLVMFIVVSLVASAWVNAYGKSDKVDKSEGGESGNKTHKTNP